MRCNRKNRCGKSSPVWTLLLERLDRARAEELLELGPAGSVVRPPAPVESAPAPLPRLPLAELEALWSACEEVDAARPDHASAVRLLEAKRTPWRHVLGLARVLPRPETYRWPVWWPGAWSRSHRLAVRLYDHQGVFSAIQARRSEGDLAEDPRQRMPRGLGRYGFGGLFMACPAGAAWLRREIDLEEIAICEGLTDWLRMASSPLMVARRIAAIGVVNGSQSAVGALPWSNGFPRVRVLTDLDPGGDAYAKEIAARVPSSVRVERG